MGQRSAPRSHPDFTRLIPQDLIPQDPAEGSMTSLATTVPIEIDHRWELRLEEFEDGHSIRRFECVDCGAVRFE